VNTQQKEKYYIGIDLGTTHMKSAVFDEHGTLVEIVKDATPVTADEYGQIYRPEEFCGLIKGQLARLLKRHGNICAISITGMSEAGLIINRTTGKEATPIIPWFDRRTVGLSNQVSKEQEQEYLCRTGLRNNYKYGIYKYLWLLEHSGIKREDSLWLSACDYIAWKLTGEFVTDPGFAARTYVYDIINHCWDEERLAGYGLSTYNFPKVLPSGERAGCLSDSGLLSYTGTKNIIVCIGGHDHVCAAYAVIREDANHICNSIGTAETFLGITDTVALTESNYHSGMVYGAYVNGKCNFWMGNISSSGQSVEWFRKKAQRTPIDYPEMAELLASLPKEPTGILYFPYLSGIGTPRFQPEADGGFFGLRENHTAGDLLKAVIEGISYQGKWILSLLPDEEIKKIRTITCVGGAANSAPWMQIKADILGIPVTVPDITEATLLGAVAVMLENNYGSQARERFLSESKDKNQYYEVDYECNKKYQEVYQRFQFLADKLLD